MGNEQTLITTLPEGVPFPKFDLFEKVRYGQETVHVIGMAWICPLDGIKQKLYSFGWVYRISVLLDKRPEDYFTTPDVKSYEIDEDELFPLSDGEVPHEQG